VRLRTSLRAVDLERVGVRRSEGNSLVSALRSVDLERVGGDFPTYDTRHDLGSGCLTDPFRSVLTSSQTDARASSASI
jgi:hypothetical protein